MTQRECLTEAWRQMGFTPKQIRQELLETERLRPGTLNSDVPAGWTVARAVESCRRVKAMSAGEKRLLAAIMAIRDAQTAQGN